MQFDLPNNDNKNKDFCLAFFNGKIRTVEKLLRDRNKLAEEGSEQKLVDINLMTDMGGGRRTGLMAACYNCCGNLGGNYLLVVKEILKCSELQIWKVDFNTALHHAVRMGNCKIVKELLKRTDSKLINKLTQEFEYRSTPLHQCCFLGLTEVVKLLLLHPGINVKAKDSMGKTPLEVSVSEEVKEVLRSYSESKKYGKTWFENYYHHVTENKNNQNNYLLGIDFALQHFPCDLEIQLYDQELKIWKSFLLHSNIPFDQLLEEEREEDNMIVKYKGLVDLDVHVDERVVYLILLGDKDVYIPFEKTIDYFLFFRRLGLKREMIYVFNLAYMRTDFSFEEYYHCFRKLEKYENEFVKSFFNQKNTKNNNKKDDEDDDMPVPKKITIDTFKTSSLGYLLFYRMKESFKVFDEKSLVGFSVNYFTRLFDSFEISDGKIFDPYQSPELYLKNEEDKNIEERIRKNKKLIEQHECLLILESTDGIQFKFHKERLVCLLGHFKRMFEFKGVEWEQLLSQKPIKIIDLDGVVLQELLNYVDFGKFMDNKNIELLTILIGKSFKYIEENVREMCLQQLDFVFEKKVMLQNDAEEMIDKFASVLYELENKEFRNNIIDLFNKWSEGRLQLNVLNRFLQEGHNRFIRNNYDGEISRIKEEMLKKDEQIVKIQQELEKRKLENEMMKKEIQQQNKKLEEMEKLIRSVILKK